MECEFFFQPSYDKLITGTESLSTICKFINHLVWVWYWLKNTDPDTPKNTDITDTDPPSLVSSTWKKPTSTSAAPSPYTST